MSLLSSVITVAKRYGTREAFKASHIAFYNVAKKKGLLGKLWPIHTCEVPPGFYTLIDEADELEVTRKALADIITMLQKDLANLTGPMNNIQLRDFRNGLAKRVARRIK
jgi:hypothetical protein